MKNIVNLLGASLVMRSMAVNRNGYAIQRRMAVQRRAANAAILQVQNKRRMALQAEASRRRK